MGLAISISSNWDEWLLVGLAPSRESMDLWWQVTSALFFINSALGLKWN